MVQAYLGPFEQSLLKFEAKWRNLKIDVCPEEEIEEEMEWVFW
jgi:hypothetical protein